MIMLIKLISNDMINFTLRLFQGFHYKRYIRTEENMKISEIYAGKPDAGDEIHEKGYEEFAANYIEPIGVSVNGLASTTYGTPFFIMGDKGTGKTALLNFLERYVQDIDTSACVSFIYFEKEITQNQRKQFQDISKSISTSVSIDGALASEGQNSESDFTYIWKWQLYQKIIADDEEFNGGLFQKEDGNWDAFVREISKIDSTIQKGKMCIPAKISLKVATNPQLGTIEPGLGIEPVDFSQQNFNMSKAYLKFIKIVDNAYELLQKLKRTDIPYYIFIDELEAYRGEDSTFYRDLRLIRDLLFEVKKLNDTLKSGTKIICSVRPEVVTSITRFIQAKQLHKIMQGYDERLNWEYTNTNSFKHPIMRVLLRRIENSEEKVLGHPVSETDTIHKWFVQHVYNKHICTYILDNTWHKPRDIVRLLLAAQSSGAKNYDCFNQHTFETFIPTYSKQCLAEIREEMCALYTAEEIEQIFSCLQGFKISFTYQEIFDRTRMLFPDSKISTNCFTVLNDMYRMGAIGNMIGNGTSPRWAYKGEEKLLIEAPWKITVHPALRIALSLNTKVEKYVNKELQKRAFGIPTNRSRDTAIYAVTIEDVRYAYILVSFTKDGSIQRGYISINNLGKLALKPGDLNKNFSIGDMLNARITGYSQKFSNWFMIVV